MDFAYVIKLGILKWEDYLGLWEEEGRIVRITQRNNKKSSVRNLKMLLALNTKEETMSKEFRQFIEPRSAKLWIFP